MNEGRLSAITIMTIGSCAIEQYFRFRGHVDDHNEQIEHNFNLGTVGILLESNYHSANLTSDSEMAKMVVAAS